ncbi:MAG TPA: hypothetical protein VFB14_28945 [Bryobacteraceae bacterium]|jgi:hypothetical protein|nr:hypothetical protein [Bryobacteraceae bacterium]
MVRYRIHKLKNAQRESFRWTAHTSGLAVVKPKDYDATGEVQAATPYAAWKTLQAEERPLSPGDLLETMKEDGNPGELLIAKYIGFEPAAWYVPEPKPDTVTVLTAEPRSPVESK